MTPFYLSQPFILFMPVMERRGWSLFYVASDMTQHMFCGTVELIDRGEYKKEIEIDLSAFF